jgi:hypothetical protein
MRLALTPATRNRYVAYLGFAVALAVVHALVGFWTPVQGEDWNHWVWAGEHRGDSTGYLVRSFLSTHFTFSDIASYALCRHRVLHVLLTPAVMLALVIGLFTIAMRRLPRAAWEDVLGVVLVSALLWIGQPMGGVSFFNTSNVALVIYGSAIAAWFFAPYRCGWQVPRFAWPLLAVAGYCVGTSTRAIATLALVGVICIIAATPRERRARWTWIGLAGLVVGTIVGYVDAPWIEFGRVFRRAFEQNLHIYKLAVHENGEIVALVAALILADRVLAMLGRGRASQDPQHQPDPTESLRWFAAWFASSIWIQFGPKYNEALLVPATCMFVIGALPYLLWIATSRWLRYLVVTFAIAVHLIAWTIALVTYHQFGTEFADRLAAMESAPKGGTATIHPYSDIRPNFWFMGEDLGPVRLRMLVAVEAFGLRDIAIDPPYRRFETNPNIEVKLEVEGATDEQIKAARVPPIWASEPNAARKQFTTFMKRLRTVAGKRNVSARLVATNVDFPQRGTRPLLLAWANPQRTVIPRIAKSPIDANGEFTIRIYGRDPKWFDEAWVFDGTIRSTPYRGGSPKVQPMRSELTIVIVCGKENCLITDAFVPVF